MKKVAFGNLLVVLGIAAVALLPLTEFSAAGKDPVQPSKPETGMVKAILRFYDVPVWDYYTQENILETGYIEVWGKIFSPPSGGEFYWMHMIWKATGVGQTSGRQYLINQQAREKWLLTPVDGLVYTAHDQWQQISAGGVVNTYYEFTYRVTRNANGEVTVEILDWHAEPRGDGQVQAEAEDGADLIGE